LSSNTSKFTKIAQQRYAGRRSGKKEEESRIKLSPRPSPEKRRQNIAKKNKRGIEGETDSARDKAGVCPIRSWANNKRARGGRAGDERGFRRFLLSSSFVIFFHSAKSSVLV
jgi:hypothetical protein